MLRLWVGGRGRGTVVCVEMEEASFARAGSNHTQRVQRWTTSAGSTRPASQELDAAARQALRHDQLRKSWGQPHAVITHNHRQRPSPLIVVATTPQYDDMSSVPRTRQVSHENSLKLLPAKHVCTWHKRGPQLKKRKGHA